MLSTLATLFRIDKKIAKQLSILIPIYNFHLISPYRLRWLKNKTQYYYLALARVVINSFSTRHEVQNAFLVYLDRSELTPRHTRNKAYV